MASSARYVYHHVVLPPKLPQKNDHDAGHERYLINFVADSLKDLQSVVKPEHTKTVESAIEVIGNLRSSRDHFGNVSEAQLEALLTNLACGEMDGALPLEVKAQNSGVIVRRCNDNIIFEFFELSPSNAAAMKADRLIRYFPGNSSSMSVSEMSPELRKSLAGTISKMSTQTAPGFQPQVRKNGKMLNEERDTTHPGLVTEFLMNLVTAIGKPTDVQRIKKHCREEILWDNCLKPWRRSPLWLLIRVSLQLHFAREEGDVQCSNDLYKAFMILLLSRLLESATNLWIDLGSETLHAISAKLVRRLRKFEFLKQAACLQRDWAISIQPNVTSAYNVMNNHWEGLVNSAKTDIDTTAVGNLQLKNNLSIALPALNVYLSDIATRKRELSSSSFNPASTYPTFHASELPHCVLVSDGYQHFHLAALEKWIEDHLASWIASHLRNEDTCGKLRRLMENYYVQASAIYAGVPTHTSLMYLNIAELWVACDKSACAIFPLLLQYRSEVCLREFQSLVLPSKRQMVRLQEIERYIKERSDAATKMGLPSVYREFGHPASFAVEFFKQSEDLQAALSQIERDATQKRQKKRQELEAVKSQYNSLMERYNNSACETHMVVTNHYHGYTELQHKPGCSRCACKSSAEALNIQIHEWPLSSDRAVAKATVFELKIPQAFSDWRDASRYFIANVLNHSDTAAQVPTFFYTLDKHHDLSHMLSSQYHARRIVLLSFIKPHTGTHRKQQKAVIHLQEKDVCLENALKYGYYDSQEGLMSARTLTCTEELAKKCMYKMPSRSNVLERFMYKPPSTPDGLPANEVIASISDCPGHFSIDEYKALAAIPLGRNIIYSNVLAQLANSAVDFTKVEAQCFILQIVQQTGLPDKYVERANHHILTETSFGDALLEQLEIALYRISQNWESWRAAATFSLLARRVLYLTTSSDMAAHCLNYLDELRNVCMTWLCRLKARASSSTEEKQRSELFSRAVEIALLCISTFDIEEKHLDTVFQHHSAVSMLLQCCITVQENQISVESDCQLLYDASVLSWKSFMYRVFSNLRSNIIRDRTGLCLAVKASWDAFHPAAAIQWVSLAKPHDHWLYIKSGALPVHFNLLTAELLVNGLPLARLPLEYMRHAMYLPLFQKSTLEVVPTDEPGMKFSAKATYHGYRLHFGMKNGDMLVIAITDSSRFDLLPSKIFQDLLPQAFITDFIHWYDHNSCEVVFRPRDAPWSSNADDWRLKRDANGSGWRLVSKSTMLVNMRSNSARVLSRMFQPIEDAKYIHVIVNTMSQIVEIELPRLKLDFFIKQGKIYSRQYRGMLLDDKQSIGTLVGLSSKLVLRNAEERMVLIPFGENAITYARASNLQHVTVNIDKNKANRVFMYSLDRVLGRILDTGDLQSRLFLCYLHAITSHSLPDPWTKHTGTEASLTLLQSAAVRSFDLLTEDNVKLLVQIANLSPVRSFYPKSEKVMQQVEWDSNLPALSQHYAFRTSVENVLDQAMKMQLFHPNHSVFHLIRDMRLQITSDLYLTRRDAIRSSTFRTLGFGSERYTNVSNVLYATRDRQEGSERGRLAFVTASMVLRKEASLHTPIPNVKTSLLQTHFRGAKVEGVVSTFDIASLRFDSKWLENLPTHLTKSWCTLHRSLANSSSGCNNFDIMTWLATMAYAEFADMIAIQALVGFYRFRDFAAIQLPTAPIFELSEGDVWNSSAIHNIAQQAFKPYRSSAEAKLPKEGSETNRQHLRRIESLFNNRRNEAVKQFTSALQCQWPVRTPSMPSSNAINKYLEPSKAMPDVISKFTKWYDNRQFLEYLENVSTKMARQAVLSVSNWNCTISLPTMPPVMATDIRHFGSKHIFAASPPSVSREELQTSPTSLTVPHEPKMTEKLHLIFANHSDMKERLENLCCRLRGYANSRCEKAYVDNLAMSCSALDDHIKTKQVQRTLVTGVQDLLQKYLQDCETYLNGLYEALTQCLAGSGLFGDQLGLHAQHFVRICPSFWLSHLHRDRFNSLSEPWKAVIIEYGLAVTYLHRAQRLAALVNKPIDLLEEINQIGHSNWDANQHPETLLLEAESGIMVREEQEFIASHMRSPPNGENVVLQLQMGGGKSTVITPMVAAALTDKTKLVRVVIAKPQSKQMLQMLISKLGGLLNRRVYHMPFSRALRLTATDAKSLRELYEECMLNRGVLLVQPEHILSFKLMGIEMLLTDQHATAHSLLSTQQFFDNVSRDVVDESDENFSVKFELIYTMGSQQAIEFAPERWLIIQEILGLIPRFALQVKEIMPQAIDIQDSGHGKFPRVRLLRSDAADHFLSLLTKHIVEWGVSGLPSRSQSPEMQAAILHYISRTDLEACDIEAIENSKFWTDSTKSPLLLVRGLIAGGVLRFALSTKRWRVNFGLDTTRFPETSLAVPYRSKDSPSPRSEFSHPDVVLILTQLSFYYGGLSDNELFDAFGHLYKSDESAIHYNEWVSTASPELSPAFRQLSGISIRDRHQCIVDVFPALRSSRKAIDYYLSYLVFPKQVKQFPEKLSASGWDLAVVKQNPTTGFSGTKDTSLHLLPLDIRHLDLPSQNHTNAQVLSYLLMDETSVELLPSRTRLTQCSDAEHLLSIIQGLKSNIRVIIDCGASILEQNNFQVAKTWLENCSGDIEAVVFFEEDELTVLDRSGRVESFQTSSFAKQLDVCIVYLDQTHSRGTDLKLPRDYRAAVTLGSQMTKDFLMQGCMRMRRLGHGQSVTFIVPEETATKIREFTKKAVDDPIEVCDVLSFSIAETWDNLKRSMPLWAVQGERFEKHRHLLNGSSTTMEQATKFLESEAQDLEVRYKPRTKDDDGSAQISSWDLTNENISQIVARCHDFEAMGFGSAALSEEQERELAPEIEEERQIERPPPMVAEKHTLHPDLQRLAITGAPTTSRAFEPAFKALRSTSAARLFNLDGFPTFPSELLVTKDFMRTVIPPRGSTQATFISDAYQRPVQFVLSVPSSLHSETIINLIIISPHEANLLAPYIRQNKKITLHHFTARSNAGFASLDDLMLYNVGRSFTPSSVSRSLTMQVNLFAGSLYLRSFEEYNELCDLLGLLRTKAKDGQQVYADGFIDPPTGQWGLTKSPIPFLRALLMKIRREGEGVSKTHLGKILSAVRLEEVDFQG